MDITRHRKVEGRRPRVRSPSRRYDQITTLTELAIATALREAENRGGNSSHFSFKDTTFSNIESDEEEDGSHDVNIPATHHKTLGSKCHPQKRNAWLIRGRNEQDGDTSSYFTHFTQIDKFRGIVFDYDEHA